MRELSLSPVSQDQSSVRVTSKTGKKRQGESNDSEKRLSEEVFNQYTHKQMAMKQEFGRESQSVQSFNFDKVQKIDNQCEMPAFLPLSNHFKGNREKNFTP